MSTMTVAPRPRRGWSPARIPFGRILWVELTKMFNTRSGFWLAASIGITALLATAAVIAFAPDSAMTYDNFGAAVGVPMVIILPVIAILSVTSEWSQRSGLTTFTLVPKRGEVIWAKLLISVALGAVSIVAALGIGAVGNLVGAAIDRDRSRLGHLPEPGHVARRGQRARPADRLHARRADPQLRGGHRGVLHLRLRARRPDRRPGREPGVVPRPPAVDRLQLHAGHAVRGVAGRRRGVGPARE